MKFHVLGANKETGDDIEVDLVAADPKQAEVIAHDRGILVASMKPVNEPSTLDPIELEPESDSASTTAALAPTPRTNGSSHDHDAQPPAAPAQPDSHAQAGTTQDAHPHSQDAHQAPHDGHVPHDAHAPQDGHAAPGSHHMDTAPHSSTHIEYRVMVNQSVFLMEKAVCRALDEGWQCVGGLATAFQNNATSYFQSMVRYPKPAEKTSE